MSCSEIYTPQLRERGYRMTPQRHAILNVLCHSTQHLSPAQVYKQASKKLPSLTEPTVYRTLEFLAENGLAQPANTGDGHLVYEIAKHEHHHLKCRNCGDEIEIEHALLKSAYQKLESASGYQLTNSHITFFGLCPDCQEGD